MSFTPTPELDKLIQERKVAGKYPSEEAVVRAALEALGEKEATLAAIAEGYHDYQQGRFTSLHESDAEFRQTHKLP